MVKSIVLRCSLLCALVYGDHVVEHPYPESLCARCVGEKRIVGARSMFVMCTRLPNKYPRQPVLSCEAYAERDGKAASDDDGQDGNA